MTGAVGWATAAAAAFGATNLDNLVALTAQLSGRRARRGQAPGQVLGLRHALRGQYLALLVLLALSAVAAAGLLLLPARGAALLGLVPLAMGIAALVRYRGAGPADGRQRSGTWAVALLSLTCGGDNVAVYGPLLAQARFPAALLVVAVFAVLVVPMCGLAGWLARRAAGLNRLRALNEKLFPAFLITVGLLVLRGALV